MVRVQEKSAFKVNGFLLLVVSLALMAAGV